MYTGISFILTFLVTCPRGTILQKCDCEPLNHCDGSWFTSMTTCTAYNQYLGSGIRVRVCLYYINYTY